MIDKSTKSKGAKVVSLETTDYQRVKRVRMARMPEVVKLTFDKSKALLLEKFKAYFELADDVLFDTADKATNNQEQNYFFDSMRELRVQRQAIEIRFIDAIESAFCALSNVNNKVVQPTDDDHRSDALSLVHSDELEEMLAVDSATARANRQFGEAVQFISLRLDSLVPVKVYQKSNPIGPDILCKEFMTQLKRLEITIQAKLVLFRLFEKSVVQQLDDVYSGINQLLIEHNVMPSLPTGRGAMGRGAAGRGAANRRPGGKGEQHHRRQSDNGDVQGANETHQAGSRLETDSLHANKNRTSQQNEVSSDVIATLTQLLRDGERQEAETQEARVSSDDLVALLSKVQDQSVEQGHIRRSSDIRKLLEDIKTSAGMNRDFGRVDDEVMKLVNMLFDFILEDRNLAPAMKSLISRMQIPMLKVAVADKTFFTRGTHVARRLLNEVATSAIGWDCKPTEQHRDPLYRKVSEVVQKLQADFSSDISFFTDLLDDFTHFIGRERRRVAILERRTIDVEDGKAKAELAREQVSKVIRLRIESIKMPDVVSGFIDTVWRNVLFVVVLKDGVKSNEWKLAVRTMDELIWSVRKPETDKQRQTLVRLVPVLIKKLRHGLEGISYNPFEMTKILKSLENLHLAAIRAKPAVKLPNATESANLQHVHTEEGTETDTRKKSPPANVISSDIVSQSIPNIPASAIVAQTHVDIQDTNKLTHAPSSIDEGQENANEQVIPTIKDAPPEELAKDSRWMVQVSHFSQGSWFDMVDESGVERRCRLAAVIKSIGRYIFVNRNGVKVAEKTHMELALALKNGQLSVLDNSMLFDRALEKIVSGLRQNKAE